MAPTTDTQPITQAALTNIEAFNAADWKSLKDSVAADVVYVDIPSQRRLEGVGQFIEEYQNWKNVAPDCKGTPRNTFVSGNTVIVEVDWKGTQTGAFLDHPPTGKTWDVKGCQVITMKNDKIKELHQYYDMSTIFRQLGFTEK
jgi:steroid delta-isomerase-like uncharacterized protein